MGDASVQFNPMLRFSNPFTLKKVNGEENNFWEKPTLSVKSFGVENGGESQVSTYSLQQPNFSSAPFGGITNLVASAPVNPNGSRNIEQVGPTIPGRNAVNNTKLSWIA